MTVNTTSFTDWQDGRQPGPPFDRCSPNLTVIGEHLEKRWGLVSLGCYGVRPVRGGEKWSSHAFGAGKDYRFENPGPGRVVLDTEVLPWLIANSAEHHIQAIHDYQRARIWRSNRGDGKGAYWKDQPPSSTGMGQPWAGWIHIETTAEGWGDTRPLDSRSDRVTVPAPTLRRGDRGPVVAQLVDFLRFFGFTKAKPRAVYGVTVERAVKRLQRRAGLPRDGRYGPKTAAAFQNIVDQVAK